MMLISKRSRRKSERFESRFREASSANFPLRQYLRCREDFSSGLVFAVLNLAFLVTLAGFTRTLGTLFDRHGQDLNPLYKPAAWALMGLFMLSVVRRLYYKVKELKEIRGEMAHLQAQFRESEDDD